MRSLRRLFKSFWEWFSEDIPSLFIALWTWLIGETWLQFGLRVTFVCALLFVLRSLWNRLSDISDQNPLATVGGLAVICIILISALGAYFAGFWRSVAPAWIP